MTRKIPPLPATALLSFLAIVIAVRIASRYSSTFPLFRPDLLAAVLFLAVPLQHYGKDRKASWLEVADLRKSAIAGFGLAAAGGLAFLAYSLLPLPPLLSPYPGPRPPLGEFLVRQGLLAALPEEVFFRGYLYDAFEEKGWEPVLPAAVVFCAGHLLILPSLYRALTFFPGLLLGWGRKKTGNVYVPILVHILFNLFPYLGAGAR
jgi:membrane protease YdiL (CAAX protease family)